MEETSYRHEFKYLISSANVQVLRTRIHGLMRPDPHTGPEGVYSIRSLYFDDYENHCYFDNDNGNDNRAKYRLRIYNASDDHISLERKSSLHGLKHKEICQISREQADRIRRGMFVHDAGEQSSELRRLTVPMAASGLRPVVIVEYNRIPYVYRQGNVRVTFDTGISSSNALGAFFEERIPKRPVMPKGLQLMEVKYDGYLPDEIRMALSLEELQFTAYSKYYYCRRISL